MNKVFSFKITSKYPAIILIFFIAFYSCKKESELTAFSLQSNSLLNTVAGKSFGILNITTGILPPVTQKTFIANGDSSIAEFQVTATRLILLRRMDFAAPALVQSSCINSVYDYKIYNDTGVMTYYIDKYIKPGSGADLFMQVYYNAVNKNNSGATARITLTHVTYVTMNDNVEHDLYLDSSIKTQSMYLVANKPGIEFQNPPAAVLNNGYKEIIQVKLSGDSNWVLNALPISIYAPKNYSGSITKCKLIVQTKHETLNTNSDSIFVPEDGMGNIVIHFINGLKHKAGHNQILKIYASVSGTPASFVSSMNPYKSLVWTDGLGFKINGNLNNQYFKDDTGFSSYYFDE